MDTFVVFDPSDRYHASVCIGEDDVRDVIPYLKETAKVFRMGEDVTEQFRKEPDQDFKPTPRRMDNWSLGDWQCASQRRAL
jgi:hypothetical protein